MEITNLRTLLDRVEKGEGADREIDVQLAYIADYAIEDFSLRAIVDRDGLQSMVKRVETSFNSVWRLLPAYTSSIDASRALVQAVTPGTLVASGSMEHGPFCSMVVPREDGTYIGGGMRAVAKSEPRAVLACLLRAKIAQGRQNA